jgi:hypothetical protein
LNTGKKEALQRYLELKEFEKGSNQFGPERRANEHAAVQVGLANLAQVAGYPDALRLEWAMEAQLAQEKNPIGRVWKIGDHRAELVIQGGEPEFIFHSKDKLLKSAPASLKSDNCYEEMKELLALVKKQYKRLKITFERMMCGEELLTGLDLENLSKLPVAEYLISRLVFAVGTYKRRAFGVYHCGSLVGLDKKEIKLAPSDPLTIAHAHTLYEHGELAGWQSAIVEREWNQPFKQVFREVYLPTETERAAAECARFSGQAVRSAVASRLLSSRAWEMKSSDTPEVVFFDRRQRLLADWSFPDASHYLAEQETITAGDIRFMRAAADGTSRKTLGKLTPAQVPPIFFSETMRDADLVCSVAAVEVKSQPSAEVRARRADAVRAVLEPMHLDNVSFVSDAVHVKGKLGEYEVKYDTAAIMRMPDHRALVFSMGPRLGNEKIFIPFADEEDPVLSQVVTAAMILAHDDQIKDKSFLQALGLAPRAGREPVGPIAPEGPGTTRQKPSKPAAKTKTIRCEKE